MGLDFDLEISMFVAKAEIEDIPSFAVIDVSGAFASAAVFMPPIPPGANKPDIKLPVGGAFGLQGFLSPVGAAATAGGRGRAVTYQTLSAKVREMFGGGGANR